MTAERLNSLLDLSSKSLVETQRLKPYLASLQRLKRIQSNSLRALDALDGQLKSLDLNLEAQEALADTRRLLSEAQALLAEKTAELDEFGWQAGQRAQVMKGGKLQFGTEVVSAADGTIAGLLGASPGASTAAPIMLDVLQKCFQTEFARWQSKLTELMPTFGTKLNENPAAASASTAETARALGITA